ncbi:MAG: methyltransferase domain-containing protein [Rhodospirillaceae bacterium]|jgi:ubiquinone/menaquinone biosynthesis C-methylase UbiE|nr:methyltransferase domain-containing protein [Rhodospirillaceae bacterium]MBT5195074.1 methyltransferase domain-containing protein [Rhodospirillaceae bacterium]MBT5895462.1 methyltransferase domain-containing protein [Rhodospirillaceae bacterium]MBT6426902.1 methyltransferase domain-containing protein [Rhodospirillaceae bacterium]MBT7759877.1 methyltransferase domain-containing protein [Rhodospirillaceae bacterium]
MAQDRHLAVAREYSHLADRYEDKWAFYVEATVRETMYRLPPDLGHRVLDIACGTGALLRAVRAAYPAAELTGTDLSPEMLAQARKNLPAEVALHTASADDLPFPDDCFDTVVTTSAFHYFQLPFDVLREVHRILRPGGRLILSDWCDDYFSCRVVDRILRLFDAAHYRCYDSTDCHMLLEETGFEVANMDRYKISWLWGLMTATARKPSLR